MDNFLMLFDASGSMKFSYKDTDQEKAKLAQKAMLTMNRAIPDLGYQSGLFAIVPDFEEVQGITQYDSQAFGEAIEGLSLPDRIFGLSTPLAEGMQRIESHLSDMSGSTAVILVTDGEENRGGSPVQVAQDLYANYDICFHVLSYAESDSQKETLDRIVSLKDCSEKITGQEAQSETALKWFVHEVFYDTETVEKDDDGDGVINSKDNCPGTPSGVQVNAAGCAVDSDNDGVPDYKDRCPNTAETLQVNSKGCPVKGRMELNVLFATNKAEIRPGHSEDLDRVARILRENPEASILIEGHTDNIGPEEYNMRLSKQRAESVKDYLTQNYDVDPQRLDTKGYGESRPVADNDTAAGRRENRRVVIEISSIPQKE
ncbi:MAG: OmpA family protein [Desulfohalobiaceae bacterium]|nr:OmpA family protein [Desulfohalobiaceae bacterium]